MPGAAGKQADTHLISILQDGVINLMMHSCHFVVLNVKTLQAAKKI